MGITNPSCSAGHKSAAISDSDFLETIAKVAKSNSFPTQAASFKAC